MPRPASPFATQPGTTMAHPWRTARSPRSSSTPRLPDTDTALPVRGRLGPQGHLLHLGHPTPPSLCGDHWGPEVIYTWAALPSPSLHGDSRSPRPSSAAGAPHVAPGPVFPRAICLVHATFLSIRKGLPCVHHHECGCWIRAAREVARSVARPCGDNPSGLGPGPTGPLLRAPAHVV